MCKCFNSNHYKVSLTWVKCEEANNDAFKHSTVQLKAQIDSAALDNELSNVVRNV